MTRLRALRQSARFPSRTARDIADQLRALATYHESTRVLSNHGVVRHLAPDIRALVDRDFTLAWVAETLTGLGLEVTEAALREWLYDRRLPV